MTILICPSRHLEAICAERSPSHVLSIASPGAASAAVPAADRLHLVFNDIAEPRPGLAAPDRAALSALLAFGQRWDGEVPMVVSCELGVSRSTAAAFIIACARSPDGEERIARELRRASPSATPNPLMVALADELLGRAGRMVEAVAAIGRGEDYVPFHVCEFHPPERGRGEPTPSAMLLSICTTCRPAEVDDVDRPGERLLAALRSLAASGAPPGLAIRPVQCLSVCKRPCTAALSAPGRYTYVFGDLDPERDAPALIACAETYAEREHGYLLWRERPEALRRGIVARIPPLGWAGEDGRHPR